MILFTPLQSWAALADNKKAEMIIALEAKALQHKQLEEAMNSDAKAAEAEQTGQSETRTLDGMICYGDGIVFGDLTAFGVVYTGTQVYNHPGTSGGYRTGLTPESAPSYDVTDHIWFVRGPSTQPLNYRQGQVVRRGDYIRFEHVKTGHFLCSGFYPAPLGSINNEVAAHGEPANTDCNWYLADVMRSTDGALHGTENPFRLLHVNSNRQLIPEDRVGAQTANRDLLSTAPFYASRRQAATLGVLQITHVATADEILLAQGLGEA